MVEPQRLLGDGNGVLQERVSFGGAALSTKERGQVVERAPTSSMLGPQRLLADGEHPLGNLGRLGVLARLRHPRQLGKQAGASS